MKNTKTIPLRENILKDKVIQARDNRNFFDQNNILCINLMGSPGAGKTTLLEISAAHLKQKVSVIEGDLQTRRDADRIEKAGLEAWQITTGQTCHLDAFMIHEALQNIALTPGQILFIENVGNLVCPASHDLGQHLNVVLLSVPEGDDKAGKYPLMFQKADLLIITKTDLTRWVNFDIKRVYEDFFKVNPKSPVIELSYKDSPENGGLKEWLAYIESKK